MSHVGMCRITDLICGACHKLGVPFAGFQNKDHMVSGSILRLPCINIFGF